MASTSVFRGQRAKCHLAKSVAGAANVTLTVDEANATSIEFTGLLTGNITVTWPLSTEDNGMDYFITNSTTGAFTITIKPTTGATGTLATQAKRAVFLYDGSEFRKFTADL